MVHELLIRDGEPPGFPAPRACGPEIQRAATEPELQRALADARRMPVVRVVGAPR